MSTLPRDYTDIPRLGSFCAENCDMIYVVNPQRTPSFAYAAEPGKVHLIEVANFTVARAAIAKDLREQDVIFYENDLPDLLEEKRELLRVNLSATDPLIFKFSRQCHP